MPDHQARPDYELLTAIADGKRWDDLRPAYPHLTEEEFRRRSQFVHDCQAKDRNAWKTWSLVDIQRLFELNYRGATVAQIAHQLGRSEAAVEFMLPGRKQRTA